MKVRLEIKTDSCALYADDGTQLAWGNQTIVDWIDRKLARLEKLEADRDEVREKLERVREIIMEYDEASGCMECTDTAKIREAVDAIL